MVLIQCEFFSEVLGLSSAMTVILPQATTTQIGLSGRVRGEVHPTLYLLHGMSDAHTIWVRRTSLERYVAPLGLAVVMPSVHRSFYTNMVHGGNDWTFISEELPMLDRSFFPLAPQREGKFVAGLSMGGYGAFKWALSHPERFAAAASLSGPLDLVSRLKTPQDPERLAERQRIFGDLKTLEGSAHNLYALDRAVVSSGSLPPQLYQCCGTEDALQPTMWGPRPIFSLSVWR
jgi:S-formylglutathione hydrolase FrmB